MGGDTLRGECQRFIDERDREMDRLGVDKLDLDRRGSRYFVHAYGQSLAVERFMSLGLMVQIVQAALGDTVYLFNEQYVVKAAEQGMPFSCTKIWLHRLPRHRQYLNGARLDGMYPVSIPVNGIALNMEPRS